MKRVPMSLPQVVVADHVVMVATVAMAPVVFLLLASLHVVHAVSAGARNAVVVMVAIVVIVVNRLVSIH